MIIEKIVCDKCDGFGRIDRFAHIKKGKCFTCNGTGHVYIEYEGDPNDDTCGTDIDGNPL